MVRTVHYRPGAFLRYSHLSDRASLRAAFFEFLMKLSNMAEHPNVAWNDVAGDWMRPQQVYSFARYRMAYTDVVLSVTVPQGRCLYRIALYGGLVMSALPNDTHICTFSARTATENCPVQGFRRWQYLEFILKIASKRSFRGVSWGSL